MKFNRNDKEQINAIVNKLYSLQDNIEPPYDVDTILKKLDIELCGIVALTSREIAFELPILERLSDNFYKLYIAKNQNDIYTYYKKAIGLMMCLFNNLKVGEKMTHYDVMQNKNDINKYMIPVLIEFLIPSEMLSQDFTNPAIIKNPNLFLEKATKKYCVPASLIMYRVIKFMEDTKKQMKEEGIDVDQMMKEMQEEMRYFEDDDTDDENK